MQYLQDPPLLGECRSGKAAAEQQPRLDTKGLQVHSTTELRYTSHTYMAARQTTACSWCTGWLQFIQLLL
jgi:hypothetical protein